MNTDRLSRQGPKESNRSRLRVAILIAMGIWIMVFLVGIAYTVIVGILGSTVCEPFEGSSQYGELRWSAWPPGPTCTFRESVHGFDEVRGPSPAATVWLVALGLGMCVIAGLSLLYRRRYRGRLRMK